MRVLYSGTIISRIRLLAAHPAAARHFDLNISTDLTADAQRTATHTALLLIASSRQQAAASQQGGGSSQQPPTGRPPGRQPATTRRTPQQTRRSSSRDKTAREHCAPRQGGLDTAPRRRRRCAAVLRRRGWRESTFHIVRALAAAVRRGPALAPCLPSPTTRKGGRTAEQTPQPRFGGPPGPAPHAAWSAGDRPEALHQHPVCHWWLQKVTTAAVTTLTRNAPTDRMRVA
jgi:hypothetical protein